MRINKAIKIIISADFIINSAFGSFAPVFAIFLTSSIEGGSAQVAGFAMSVYWISKSLIQLPIARFLDRTDGEKDDFYALICGYIVASVAIFMYSFAATPTHIYLIQALLGVSMAFVVPAWYGVFTRHIDKGETSFEWSLESVLSVGVATSISGAVGGIVANRFGFEILFIGASILSLLGALSLIFLLPHLEKGRRRGTFSPIDVKARHRNI